MRKRFAWIIAVLTLLVPALTGAVDSEGERIDNGDFSSVTEGVALPDSWQFDAYTQGGADAFIGEDAAWGAVVWVAADEANDARVCQTVSAEPDTVYRLSAMVRTEGVSGGTGASLSIDNYDLDGTYCYSENLHGDHDWTAVELYVRTGEAQRHLRVALRLGGYGTMASGAAAFADVSLVAAQPTDGETVVDLMTENGTVSGFDTSEETTPAPETPGDFFLLMALVTLVMAAIFVYIYVRHLRSEGSGLPAPTTEPARILAIMLAAAFLARLALSLIFFGHSTDISCFMAWGNAALNNGISNFYTSGMFADYPPGYMYICGFLAWICRLLGIPYGSDAMAFLFKLPATLADLFSAYFVYRIAKRSGSSDAFALLLAGLLAFNPVLMFVSGAWGQIDTLLTLLLVLTCYCFIGGKRILAGAIYGLAILMKPQALMLGPVLAAAYIVGCVGPDWKKRLVETVAAVLAALAALFALSLPFRGAQDAFWLVDKYVSTAGGYPFASVEAFNLAALFNGNWRQVDTVILGLSYRAWGTIGIVLATAFAIFIYIRGRKRNPGALYLSGALMIVGVFTLGHFMHERYLIPAIMLLLIAYIAYRDRRLLAAFGAVSVSALLNVMAAMYIVDHQSARTAAYRLLTAFGSAMSVLGFALLCYVAVRIVLVGETLPAVAPPKRAMREASAFDGKPAALPDAPYDGKLHYTKRDIVYVLAVTLVYGVVALTNLGTTKSPQTFYTFSKPGETVVVDLGGMRHIGAYEVFGNIDNDGELVIGGANGGTTFTQTYDDMFRWKRVETDLIADKLTLTLSAGSVKINEIAFFDTAGNLLPVTLAGGTEAARALFDEQDAVPEIPSYYNGMYFDELYHGRTAYEHLHNLAPYENSHPPLGKLFIMLGVAIFGMCPFGWRVVGALFGIGMLPIFYAFGKRMFRGSSNYALLATTLFAFDFMHFTQTRIATIDVYAVFFILLMYYYMYQYMQMNFFTDGLKKTYKPLFLAGLFFGVGAACKWTCIYAGGGLAVLLLLSLIQRYREYARVLNGGSAKQRQLVAPFWNYVLRTLLACCVFYIVIPVAIYFASYTPYFIYEAGRSADSYYGFAAMCRTFWHYQDFMYSYHSGLNATHPYQSLWYTWPLTLKPMWYYFNSYSQGAFVSTLTASGNPAVWWVGTAGTVALFVGRVTGRMKRSPALAIIAVGILANYLPWVAVTRCTFIYHFFACVPFIILAAVYLLQILEERNASLAYVKWAWMALAIVFFILLYPGLSGLPVSNEWAAILHKLPGGKLMYGAG